MQKSQLSNFFYPSNIAVIGVSPDMMNLGKNIVLNLLTLGFKGEIIPVGLREGVVFGQQIYPTVEDYPRDIHLAVILTPAKTIPGILEQCGRKGIKWVVIESSGFSEYGEEGKTLEKACLEVARKYGIRFIGPNGIGAINMENGVGLPFMPLRGDLTLGPISILSQSGGVALSYLGFLAEENIGINKFVSMGNKLNVDENDLLSYLIEDEGTRIILVYLEGFTDGRKFMEIASRSQKPILLHKSNRFQASAKIASSHTAALFSDDTLVDHALEQAGCVRVNTSDDAMDYIKSLTLPTLKGNRLAAVSRSGGHAVIATDACAHYGFVLPKFPEGFLKKFESHFRAHVIRPQNPLDLGDLFDLEFYEYIVEEMLKREDVDGVLLGHGYRKGFEQEASRELLQKVEQLVDQYQKPVAAFIMTEALEREYLKKHLKIPIFSAPENAMRAFHLSYTWDSRRPIPLETAPGPKGDLEKAQKILQNAAGESLLLSESMNLLESYGYSLPRYRLVRTPEEAVQAWRDLGGPLAMKVNRPHISHKSDSGLVRLSLDCEEDLTKAFQDFQKMVGQDLEVFLQSMVAGGREVILGGKQDPTFGPVVLFGLGGIFVEVFEDVTWRVAPINREEAQRMISATRGAKILQGLRGEKPYDIAALQDLIAKLSRILAENPRIQEIDINPLMVLPEGRGAIAVDARVILREKRE